MASALITTRRTKSGSRYVVRYRLGGRAYPLVHGGSFRTLKEARARRDVVAGELAAGRNPADALHAALEPVQRRTFAQWAEAYRASRVDVAGETAKNIGSHLKAMETFDDRDPASITLADVQEWLATLEAEADVGPPVHRDAARDPRLRRRRPEPGKGPARPAPTRRAGDRRTRRPPRKSTRSSRP